MDVGVPLSVFARVRAACVIGRTWQIESADFGTIAEGKGIRRAGLQITVCYDSPTDPNACLLSQCNARFEANR
jgi:hypothetical protein